MNTDKINEVAEQFEFTNGIYGFKEGVKWQQEISYFDMQYYMEYCIRNGYITPQEWILNHKHY